MVTLLDLGGGGPPSLVVSMISSSSELSSSPAGSPTLFDSVFDDDEGSVGAGAVDFIVSIILMSPIAGAVGAIGEMAIDIDDDPGLDASVADCWLIDVAFCCCVALLLIACCCWLLVTSIGGEVGMVAEGEEDDLLLPFSVDGEPPSARRLADAGRLLLEGEVLWRCCCCASAIIGAKRATTNARLCWNSNNVQKGSVRFWMQQQ